MDTRNLKLEPQDHQKTTNMRFQSILEVLIGALQVIAVIGYIANATLQACKSLDELNSKIEVNDLSKDQNL